MEFGFEPVCDQVPAGSSYIDVKIARTCSNLVADRFAAGLSQIPLRYLVADRSEAGRRHVPNLLACASELDDMPNSNSLHVCDQLRTCLRPDSVMEFGPNMNN